MPFIQKRKGGEIKFEKVMAQYEHLKAPWLLNVPPGLMFTNYTFCPHSVLMCFVWISEKNSNYFLIQH